MAIEITREKESATITSLNQPYYVRDPEILPGSKLDRIGAIAAVGAQGVIDQGTDADDFSFERLAYNVARVTLAYREIELKPLHPISVGEAEYGFNGIAFHPRRLFHSLGRPTNWREPSNAPDFGGAINVQAVGGALQNLGYDLVLPTETDYANYVIPNGSFDAAYRAVVASLLFKVNDTTIFGYDPGEVMLVRAQARQRTDDDLFLSFGFSIVSNGPRTIGTITTGFDVEGHDLVWSYDGEFYDNPGGGREPILVRRPLYAYVERIWNRGNHNLLGLPTP
jgi:hypothetical protein